MGLENCTTALTTLQTTVIMMTTIVLPGQVLLKYEFRGEVIIRALLDIGVLLM
jgi:ABC-type sulfate transport system permease component